MIVDLFLVYQFVKRLATPFKEWNAFKLGIIDEKGNILKGSKDRRLVAEREAFGKFDLMVLKLKKLLEKVPGGNTRLGTYAAALWLIKEQNENPSEQQLIEYMDYIKENTEVNKKFELMTEEGIVNSVGAGKIDGIGIGPKGEPGVKRSAMNRYKKKNQDAAPKPRMPRGIL